MDVTQPADAELRSRHLGGTNEPVLNDNRRHLYRWLVIGIVIGGAIARVTLFVTRVPRYDESWTHLHYSTTSLWDALSVYNTPNNHIFHSILSRLAQIVADGGILVSRTPALLAGILLIPTTVLLARQMTASRRIAVFSGMLVAFNPQLIMYSSEARGYTLIALLAVIWAAIGYRVATHAPVHWLSWLTLSVVSAFGVWTQPVFVYTLAGLTTWAIVLRAISHGLSGRFVGAALASGALAAALGLLAYLPAISRMGLDTILTHRLLNTTDPTLGGVPGRELSSFFQLLPDYVASVAGWMVEALPLLLALLFALLVVIGISSPQSPIGLRILVPLFIPGALALLAAQRLQPLARSWAPLLPLLCVTAAAGAAALTRRRLAVSRVTVAAAAFTIVLATGALMLSALDYNSPLRDDYAADIDETMALIEERFPEGATILVHPNADPQTHYWLSQHPDLVLGGDTRLVVIDHRLDGSLDDLPVMMHVIAFMNSQPADSAGVSKDDLVLIAEFGSSSVYWNGR